MAKRYIRDPNALWAAVRKLKRFTRQDLLRHLEIDRDSMTLSLFLKRLLAGGYIVEVRKPKVGGTCKGAGGIYVLVKDVGIQCPRLDDNGAIRPPNERQRIWSAVKVIGNSPFDWRDLSLVTKTKKLTTKEFCFFLQRAGYLHIVGKSVPGTPEKYVFVRSRDTGPLPPAIRARRTEVFDMNRKETVWKKGHVRAIDAKSGKIAWVKGGAHGQR